MLPRQSGLTAPAPRIGGALGLPVALLESRQAAAALTIQRTKTDRRDARGLAQLVRTCRFR